jgi:hypothetical protein
VGARRAQDGGAVGGVGDDTGKLGLDRCRNRPETIELLVEEVGFRFVGGGEVGPDSGQLEPRILGAGTGQGQHLRRIGVAQPPHAAVVLDVDTDRSALGAAAGADHLAEAVAPDRNLRPRRERIIEIVGVESAHRQQRDLRKAAADLRRLGAGGHRQPGRAASQGGACAGVGAVPVTVGLDHGAELGAVAQLGLQPRAVTLDRA